MIKDAIAFGGAAAHAPTQLVQLRQAEALGMFHDHYSSVGNVDTDFDDRGRDKHVDLAALKTAHDDFFLVGIEAAMEQADTQTRERTGTQLFMHLDSRFELLRCLFLFKSAAGSKRCIREQAGGVSLASADLASRRRGLVAVGFVVREVQFGLSSRAPSMTGYTM